MPAVGPLWPCDDDGDDDDDDDGDDDDDDDDDDDRSDRCSHPDRLKRSHSLSSFSSRRQ